jgi:hypothetical protein
VAGKQDDGALTSRQAKACRESDVNQLMFESGESGHKRSRLLSGQTSCMKTYKGNGVASDDLSTVESPDKFHEGDQYAGRENGRGRARVSRDSSIMPTGCHCKKEDDGVVVDYEKDHVRACHTE